MSDRKFYQRYQRLRRQLRVVVRRAYRKHQSVRGAAEWLGMPRSTFHDVLSGKVGAK